MNDAEIIIVGGGPVGMGLAIDLAQRGVASVVVERHPEPQPVPKGQNLTQRTVEHFRAWGVEDAIRAAVTIPKDFGIGGLTAYGTLLSDYSYDWLQREKVRPYYYTDNERLPQYQTEKVLRARAAELPEITLLYGWSAEQVEMDADGASVTIAARAGGERRTLRGAYVVGCDGARSVVRDQVGIRQISDDHDRRMVLLVFRSPELHKLLERYPGKSYINVVNPELDGYWQFFGRVDLEGGFFFHRPVPPDTTRDNFDFRRLLHEAVGAEFALEFEYIGFWDLRIATAVDYRMGRAFIAGDAAHSHPPYGGYGINTGFEDARNLAWKLAARLEGWGGEALLDSYSAERQPVFASTAKDFIARMIEDDREFVRTYSPDKDLAAFEAEWARRGGGGSTDVFGFEPNYEGSPVVFGPEGAVCSARGAHDFSARAGHHLAPQPLSTGRIPEALGPGFTLLAFDADPGDVAGLEAAAKDLGLPLTVIRDSRADGREKWDAKLVLVRPDHFVAFAGDRPSVDPANLLKRSAGRL